MKSAYSQLLAEDLRNPTLVSFLDLSRWWAAAIVFVSHLRNPLFLGYGDVPPESRTLAVKLWYFVTGLHAEAVIVFFVLSGFLVAGVGATRVAEGTFGFRGYLIDRASRLYIAFLPALLLCYCLDIFGSNMLSEVGYWNHTHPMISQKVTTAPFEDGLAPQVLLMNSLMLQHYWVEPVGSNQPLWTISTEFWFYIAFGLAAMGFRYGGWRRMGTIGLLFGMFIFLGLRFPLYLGCWLVGMLVVYLPRTKWLGPFVTLFAFGCILFAVRLWQSPFDENWSLRTAKNYAVSIGFALAIASLRGRTIGLLEHAAKFNHFLADFSYSLYLLHFPLSLFILAVLYHVLGLPGIASGYDPTSLEGLLVYGAVIASIYFVAWAFSSVTEARTAGLRKFLKRRLIAPPEHALAVREDAS